MIKNRLILTGIFIEMGVIEIEYELNKINVFTKSDEEPTLPRNTQSSSVFYRRHAIQTFANLAKFGVISECF